MPISPLTESDLELILPWRNAPAVRRAMFTHHEITLDEHRAWFARMQQDPTRRWYLYRDDAGIPQGVGYLVKIDMVHKTAFMGFYGQPRAPSGTGRRVVFEAMQLAFDTLGLHKISCEVLANNPKVINMHKKSGLIEEGRFREEHFDGVERVDVVRLAMLAPEWAKERERMLSRLRTPATRQRSPK